MGLFTREPAEKRAYDKAFAAMLSKPNDKTFAAMEAASMNWPSGWQGYLFMGLCYDLASCKAPFDPGKADVCHQRAKEAGKKAGCKWLDGFYSTFEEAAGNFRMEGDYFPRTEYIRKAGTAMLQWYRMDKNVILPEKGPKQDVDLWYTLFMGIDTGSSGMFKKRTDEQRECLTHCSGFCDYITACYSYQKGMREEIYNIGKSLLDNAAELKKKHTPEVDEVLAYSNDMDAFVNGYVQLIGGGPFIEVITGMSRLHGWEWVWGAADKGCMPALHLLADLFTGDMGDEICEGFASAYGATSDRKRAARQLLALLELSAGKNDPGAMRRVKVITDDGK